MSFKKKQNKRIINIDFERDEKNTTVKCNNKNYERM